MTVSIALIDPLENEDPFSCQSCGSGDLQFELAEWRDVSGETFNTEIMRCLECGATEEIP